MAESREKSDGLREAFEKAAKEVYLDENFTVLFRRESDGGYSFMDVELAYEMYQAGRRDALEEQARTRPTECRCWCGRECGCVCHDL